MYNICFVVLMVYTSTGDVLKMSKELKDIQGVVNQTSQVSIIKIANSTTLLSYTHRPLIPKLVQLQH